MQRVNLVGQPVLANNREANFNDVRIEEEKIWKKKKKKDELKKLEKKLPNYRGDQLYYV